MYLYLVVLQFRNMRELRLRRELAHRLENFAALRVWNKTFPISQQCGHGAKCLDSASSLGFFPAGKVFFGLRNLAKPFHNGFLCLIGL